MTRPVPNGAAGGRPPRVLGRHLAELAIALVILALTTAFAVYTTHPHSGDTEPTAAAVMLDPASLRSANTTNRCDRGEIVLTFDDGPDRYTRPILDVLHAYGVRATFFVVGAKARAHPDLVRAEAAEGHVVGNHSWDHPHLTDLTPAQIRSQLTTTQDAITAAGAPSPVLLRPPFGDTDETVEGQAKALGLRTVLWSQDTDDWRGRTADDIKKAVLDQLTPGAVIMMHDGTRESANTLQALPGIIEGLRARGFCTAPMR